MLPARALFAAYALGTFVYALLAYDPFTYTQVLKFDLLPGLGAFARLHAALYFPAQVMAALSIWPALRQGRARWPARAYLALAAAGGLALLVHPLLPGLESSARSLAIALLALVPLLWLALIDLLMEWHLEPQDQAAPDPARPLVYASVLAGLLVYAAFAAVAVLRGEPPSILLVYSLALHVLCALVIAAVLLLVTAPASPRLQLALGTVAIAVALAFAARKGLGAIAFPPAAALPVSVALGLVLAVSLLGLGLHETGQGALRGAQPPVQAEARSAGAPQKQLQLLFAPLSLPAGLPAFVRVLVPLSVSTLVSYLAAGYDWNFLVQLTCAACAWLFTLAALVTAPRPPPIAPSTSWLAGVTALGLGAALAARALAGAPALAEALPAALARDASLRALAPVSAQSTAAGAAFFELLARHTNLPSSTRIAPLDVQLSAAPLSVTPGKKPDIFIIVVDSLRRDYLPPYAPGAAGFAPNVAAFAREAVVFTNAFTHYGATGLSEPSIWVGGMMPHKQYITPFAPMNALAKLLVVENYTQLVSLDAILEVVVPRAPGLVRLDEKVPNKDYALCRTLAELRQKLEQAGRGSPAFAYTQPQDIHVSRIAREGNTVPAGATFPAGFHPPVASRLQRMDACFGDFLKWLDAGGRGDDAIVVLTADHGDSLGEEGRWGHAYTLFPEIVRIPLLVRLPKAWRSRARCRPDELAFSADLTPTLYALLGHPVVEQPPFGAPLCALDAEPPPRHQGPELLASSYGPVYGLLEQGGARLYIADAVNYIEEAFALGEGPPQRLNLGPAEKAAAERIVVEKLRQLEGAYGMQWE